METTQKQKNLSYLLGVAGFVIGLILDQFSKYLAATDLKQSGPNVLINGVFQLRYLENRGAAFGMLQNQKIFFVFIAVIFLSVIIFVLLRTPDDRKYRKLHILLTMIAAGAIGNMIDRLRFDYVVDFIYFSLINFPVFNVADIYVTTAAFLLVILILFFYQEEDFDRVFSKKREQE